MRTEGIDNLKAIFRRSRWIVLLLVVLAAVQMNLVRRGQGPLYSASAQVVLSPTDLASALAGLNSYVDPTNLDETEKALADSHELFAYAARKAQGAAGTADDLQSAISVDKTGPTIYFSAKSSEAADAVTKANAVADAYPQWRAGIASTALDAAISQLRTQIAKTSNRDPDAVTQLNKLRLLKTVTSGNVLLVEKSTGAAKTRPKPIRDTLLGAFIGLFVALIVVGIREALDTRIRTEQEVEELLTIPVVATIERLPRRASSVVLNNRDYERYADMYALLAASIARLREGTDRVVIAVTSATATEGKTTTAINLALALARRNESVGLIDLDTRRPSIARMLRIPREAHGVDSALLQGVDPATLLWDVSANGAGLTTRRSEPRARRAGAAGTVHVLPMGSSTVGSVSPHSDRLLPLIDSVGRGAEYVIVDTPPALSVPDMTELAKLADIVLVVVRHGRATRRNLDALRRLHRTWPTAELQAVVVDTPPDGDTYSYYAGD